MDGLTEFPPTFLKGREKYKPIDGPAAFPLLFLKGRSIHGFGPLDDPGVMPRSDRL